MSELVEAKASILALTNMPFQRSWAEALQQIELKREVAGTSRIEGADFTEKELDEAIAGTSPPDRMTRSQRQARAAMETYRWIEKLARDRPIDEALIKEVHRRIVTGCDDDHCPPGALRGAGHNVAFGIPAHRGVEGGKACASAFKHLSAAAAQEFRAHDPLIQAVALHYHLGAMHPFLDGNGRTARALEALMLQRSRLKGALFVAMSNYYYDEKNAYLAALSAAAANRHDITPFLKFGLRGIASQCQRLLREINIHVSKSLFRDVMNGLYGRLMSTRKRALAHRQIAILNTLLDADRPLTIEEIITATEKHYLSLAKPVLAFVRDLIRVAKLGAVNLAVENDEPPDLSTVAYLRLKWATAITETEFYERMSKLPEAKTRLIFSPKK